MLLFDFVVSFNHSRGISVFLNLDVKCGFPVPLPDTLCCLWIRRQEEEVDDGLRGGSGIY